MFNKKKKKGRVNQTSQNSQTTKEICFFSLKLWSTQPFKVSNKKLLSTTHWNDENEYEKQFNFTPKVAKSESVSFYIDEHLMEGFYTFYLKGKEKCFQWKLI